MKYTENFFSEAKIENSIGKRLIFLMFLLKTLFVSTLKSTHNLCFETKIMKLGIPLHSQVLPYKSGVQGVYITWTCFRDGYDINTCI